MRERRYVHNIPAARQLRQSQTETEELLWNALRDRGLSGLKFRRQHAIEAYVVDFYCAELSLAVEIDGSVHDDVEQQARDSDRQHYLGGKGVRFVRVRASEVERNFGAVLNELRREASALTPDPSPDDAGEGSKVFPPPLPPGRETRAGEHTRSLRGDG